MSSAQDKLDLLESFVNDYKKAIESNTTQITSYESAKQLLDTQLTYYNTQIDKLKEDSKQIENDIQILQDLLHDLKPVAE